MSINLFKGMIMLSFPTKQDRKKMRVFEQEIEEQFRRLRERDI